MGGILGLFDLGSVTAFQGVDVVGAAVGAFIFLIFVLIFLFATLKVVKEYERIVNFRLGKAQAEKGPGIVVVIPGIDKPSASTCENDSSRSRIRHASRRTTLRWTSISSCTSKSRVPRTP